MHLLALVLAATSALGAQEISAARIRAHVRYLSGDLLEGRGAGTRGGALTTEYLATQLALAGLKPAGEDGFYFQRVPLAGVQTLASTQMAFEAGGEERQLEWLSDYAGVSYRQAPVTDLDTGVVFVGHGEYGDVDVRGRTLLAFAADHWTDTLEQASEKGAAAVLLIGENRQAFSGGEVLQLRDDAGEGLGFAGWIGRDAATRLLAPSGMSVDGLLANAGSANFRPIRLPLRLRARIASEVRRIDARNVAAMAPGAGDAGFIAYTAHWDHLGVGPEVDGDPIYNGAVDNATGCGVVLEIARAWAALEVTPRRGALFLFLAGGDVGMPIPPPAALTGAEAVLNYHALHPLGRARAVMLSGADKTPFQDIVEDAARRYGLVIEPDPGPGAGPSTITIRTGAEFAGLGPEESRRRIEEFGQRRHRRPSDEFQADWDFTSLEQVASFGFLIGRSIADR